jgi:allantoin racemase
LKIKYIIPFALGDDGLARRAAQVPTEALDSETIVDCVCVRSHPAGLDSHYDASIVDMYVAEAGLSAEDEGYDAVLMDTVSDSALRTLRSRLTIPVIGPGLAAYAVAIMLGRRFSVITYVEEHRFFFEDTLDAYDLRSHCASVRAAGIEPDFDGLLGAGRDAKLARLAEVADQAIREDRAEVLLLGSTTMHEAGQYLSENVAAPVVNPGPVAIKITESLVKLGLAHSKVAYPGPVEARDWMWHSLEGLRQGAERQS